MLKRRIHDGIVGVVLVISVALGHYVNSYWHLLNLVVGLLLIQSAFTCFCPVYFLLDKVLKSENA